LQQDPGMTTEDQPKSDCYWQRFLRAAEITADNWRDPQHDWAAIRLASPAERVAIEQYLVTRGVRHPVDAEALSMLGTPSADHALREAFRSGSAETRAAVARFAPQVIEVDAAQRELLRRIEECDVYHGLSMTLEQIEAQYSVELLPAMLRRIARDPGVTAVHFAGLLLYLHDQAPTAFDWEQRDFLLRFNPGDEEDRKGALSALCRRLGVSSTDCRAMMND